MHPPTLLSIVLSIATALWACWLLRRQRLLAMERALEAAVARHREAWGEVSRLQGELNAARQSHAVLEQQLKNGQVAQPQPKRKRR